MKRMKLILIVVIALFIIAASGLIYAGIKQEPSSDACQLPLSDLVSTSPAKFENLKTVIC